MGNPITACEEVDDALIASGRMGFKETIRLIKLKRGER
jgi:hypothetical protein